MRGKSLSWLIVSLVVGISLIISACAPAAPAPEVPEVPKEEAVRFTIGGGSLGGNSNLAGNALGGIAKNFLGIDSTVITVSTLAQPKALHEGLTDMSTGNSPTITYEYTGEGIVEPHEPWHDLRILLYRAPSKMLLFVPPDSPIKSYKDLVGKRVSAGKKGFIADLDLRWICDALGVSYGDVDVAYIGHKDAGAAIIAGKIDAAFCVAPGIHPTYSEIDLMYPLRVIPFSKEEADAIHKKYPFLREGELLKLYRGMDEPIRIVEQADLLATTNRLPEDIAYGMVKSWIENPEFVGYFHTALQDYLESGWVREFMETATDPTPYHAGVVRYLKEVGWNIPPNKIPPEYKE